MNKHHLQKVRVKVSKILSFGMSGTDFYEHFIMIATGFSLHLYYLEQVV